MGEVSHPAPAEDAKPPRVELALALALALLDPDGKASDKADKDDEEADVVVEEEVVVVVAGVVLVPQSSKPVGFFTDVRGMNS